MLKMGSRCQIDVGNCKDNWHFRARRKSSHTEYHAKVRCREAFSSCRSSDFSRALMRLWSTLASRVLSAIRFHVPPSHRLDQRNLHELPISVGGNALQLS